MRKFKFKGYQEELTCFGDGTFTVDSVYEAVKVCGYYGRHLTPDALFVDDNGEELWEELHHFEEVFDNAK